ncbi:hypothetical protein BKA70DRAFT_1252320 [Coprinopsis sp. MPI-PUGE-AT-0042]|nr:hypothetical protein BKA70DRAFT_1252320 [Coprinopsis sp. MPI-PUGE-AT-0042]
MSTSRDDEASKDTGERQCRICLDGTNAEIELGRLISPCLCKGSIRYVHVRCLERWRKTSVSQGAFFACPQCHYQYRFARTQVLGLASNKLVIALLSGLSFTAIVMLASLITTYLASFFEELSSDSYYTWSYFGYQFVSPVDVARDLITATFRVLKDGDIAGILDEGVFPSEAGYSHGRNSRGVPLEPSLQSGVVMRFVRRFLLGLPLVGAVSVVHLLLSFQFLAPVQWLARYRGSRRRDGTRDVAALIVVALILVGAVRAFYKVYQKTEYYVKRFLMRAEDAILEVNA